MSTETTQHTPGPWRVVTWNEGGSGEHIGIIHDLADGDRIDIAAMLAHTDANARLIAAAPELLSELEAAMSDVDCYCQHGQGLCNAHEVIAKARGT